VFAITAAGVERGAVMAAGRTLAQPGAGSRAEERKAGYGLQMLAAITVCSAPAACKQSQAADGHCRAWDSHQPQMFKLS